MKEKNHCQYQEGSIFDTVGKRARGARGETSAQAIQYPAQAIQRDY